jgi:hypothetical protein
MYARFFSADYSCDDARGRWAHRTVGVGHAAPEHLRELEFMLTDPAIGICRFELENIRIHRRDGTVKILWESGMPLNGMSAPPGISGLRVR